MIIAHAMYKFFNSDNFLYICLYQSINNFINVC